MLKVDKYYLFDLDGTLLNDNHVIPDKTAKWLDKLKEEGHKLGIVTGRPYEAIMAALSPRQFGMFEYVVSYNGSRIDYNGTTEFHRIPLAELDQFINIDEYVTTVSIGEVLYADNIEGASDIIKRISPKEIAHLSELQQDLYSIRLVFRDEEHARYWYEIFLSRIDKTLYNVVMSTGVYILITPKSASKAEAIKSNLLDYKIIFFGDSHNDLPVFQMNNVTKVAPANAYPEVKALADYVLEATNNESLEIDI